ncbi:MAG: hypothetical protein ABI142_02170, partial [Bryocella sp.]
FSPGSPVSSNVGATFNTNGIRSYYNSYYIDGAYNGTLFRGGGAVIPNPDALQEFRILTSNFDSEFGRTPGAVVNIVTRSGTNALHGTVWEYVRNDALNAANYFSKTGATPINENLFGASVGGPVFQNKLFYFGSYQGFRSYTVTQLLGGGAIFGTPAERAGDFRNSKIKATKISCAGVVGVVCPSAFDPVALAVLSYVPVGDATGAAPSSSAPSDSRADQGLARLDYQVNAAHRLQMSFFEHAGTGYDRTKAGNQVLSFSGDTLAGKQVNGDVNDTWVVSPRMVNSLRLFFSQAKSAQDNVHPEISLATLGSLAPEPNPNGHSQPLITIAGYFKTGNSGSGPLNQLQTNVGFNDTLQWSLGNHTLKLGGSLIYFQYAETGYASGAWTFAANSATGNALADFMTGRAATYTQSNGAYHRLHVYDPSVFVQDDWRVLPRVTLNLGVRWEVYPPYTGENNFGTYVAGAQSTRFPTAPVGLLSAGDPGIPDGILHTSYTKFSPRIGFAADVFGNGTTSLRGGYGIFFSASQETFIGNLEQVPFKLQYQLVSTPSLVDPYSATPGGSPFPYSLDPANPRFTKGATLSGLNPDRLDDVPYVQEYNLTMEQQFGKYMSTRIAYVGNSSRKFYLARDQNAAIYAPGATIATANARRPLQGYGAINLLDASANGNYNALQASLIFRVSDRIRMSANYTWSKQMDYVSGDPGSNSNYALEDQYDPSKDYALSTLDQPHRVVVNFVYQLPGTTHFGFVGKQILSGWQVNGIARIESGTPLNVLSGTDSNADTIATDRPDQLRSYTRISGSRSNQDKIAQWFDTSAFAKVAPNVPFGTARRNSVFSPGNFVTDASVFKQISFPRKTQLELRMEAFNVFNHVNLGNPGVNFSGATFGKINGAGDPRLMQFSARFRF